MDTMVRDRADTYTAPEPPPPDYPVANTQPRSVPKVRDIPSEAMPTPPLEAVHTPEINKAVAAVLAEMTWVEKRGRNDFHRYDYATADDLRAHVAELLGRHGLSYVMTEGGFRQLDRYIACTYHFRLEHVSGEVGPLEQVTVLTLLVTNNGKPDDKAFSKARVLALKDWTKTRFSIPTGEDYQPAGGDDPDAPTPEQREELRERDKRQEDKAPGARMDLLANKRRKKADGPEDWLNNTVKPALAAVKSIPELADLEEDWKVAVDLLRREHPGLHSDYIQLIREAQERVS